METLKEAWEKATKFQDTIDVDLIVDGGPENVNQIVDRFIATSGVSITKKIALKDISFSNSMIEATNEIIKYYYLYLHPVADGAELSQTLKQTIHDFNYQRPHGKLNGLTPDEAIRGDLKAIEGFTNQLINAQSKRKELNQRESCGNCLS